MNHESDLSINENPKLNFHAPSIAFHCYFETLKKVEFEIGIIIFDNFRTNCMCDHKHDI